MFRRCIDAAIVVCACSLAAACGIKGPLYLPAKPPAAEPAKAAPAAPAPPASNPEPEPSPGLKR